MQGKLVGPLARTDFKPGPLDIRVDVPYWEAFGSTQVEQAALNIVDLCRELGGWVAFSHSQFVEHYNLRTGERGPILIDPLVHGGWIEKGADGRYRVTEDFICRCYSAAPTT